MIVWLDIETTGLVAGEGVILEVACAVARNDAPTEVIADCSWVLYMPDLAMLGIDPKVHEMHTKSGLWRECLTGIAPAAAEAGIYRFLQGHKDSNLLTIAGASVGSFDLVWLKHHMPDVAALFSHRVLDTTSIRMFCEDLGMPRELCSKGENHRALDDCAEAISHYETCFRWIQERMQ